MPNFNKIPATPVASAVDFLLQRNFTDAAYALQNEFVFANTASFNACSTSGDISASQCANELGNLIELHKSALDNVKTELYAFFFPIFVHVYILLIIQNDVDGAHAFYSKHASLLLNNALFVKVIENLLDVEPHNCFDNKMVQLFRRSRYHISLSKTVNELFERFINLNVSLKSLVDDLLQIEIVEHSTGASNIWLGECVNHMTNNMFFDLLSEERNTPLDDIDRRRKGGPSRKGDLASPSCARIPLPERNEVQRPSKKRIVINADNPAWIYIYTLLNFKNSVSSACISDDSKYMSATFTDNRLAVFGLKSSSLLRIKPINQLEQIDLENVTTLTGLLCDERKSNVRILYGHSGPVYNSSFNYTGDQVISCSQDSTIRLWSLRTYSTLSVFKDIGGAIWDVQFGPFGHYFLSGGRDTVAKLWSTDAPLPLRMFTGHLSDITCVAHHPNANYVATGSHDYMVRVWDVLDGRCVLLFTAHSASVSCLTFSNDGRFLVSGGRDGYIMLWSLLTGQLAVRLVCSSQINSLCFSRDGEILASGEQSSKILIWDFRSILRYLNRIGGDSSVLTLHASESEYVLSTHVTKDTALYSLHFTARNLLLGVDMFHDDSVE